MRVDVRLVDSGSEDWAENFWVGRLGDDLAHRAMTCPRSADRGEAASILSEVRQALPQSKFEEIVDLVAVKAGLSSGHVEAALTSVMHDMVFAAEIGSDFLDVVAASIVDATRTRHGQSSAWSGLGYNHKALAFPTIISSAWHENDERIFAVSATPDDVPPNSPASVAYARPSLYGGGLFQLHGMREIRPIGPIGFCKRAFEITAAFPARDVNGATIHVGWNRGQYWGGLGVPVPEAFQTSLPILFGRVFCARYEWSAKLATGGLFGGINVVCSPDSALELFQTRTLAPGTSRRQALLHWVKSHSRRTKSGGSAAVREHMRGIKSFDWNGIAVELKESAFDRERDARARNGQAVANAT